MSFGRVLMSSRRPCTLSKPCIFIFLDKELFVKCVGSYVTLSSLKKLFLSIPKFFNGDGSSLPINRLTYASVRRTFENVEHVANKWERMGFSLPSFVAKIGLNSWFVINFC